MKQAERRENQRTERQVIVHCFYKGKEKVFEALSRNISPEGLYIDTDPEVLGLLEIGASLIIFVEYEANLLVRLKGYVVRVDTFVSLSGGFALKFLELDNNQRKILEQL